MTWGESWRRAGRPSRRRVQRTGWSLVVLLFVIGGPGCGDEPESREVEVEIRQIMLDPASRSPVVLLQDKQREMVLPIWVGPAEARAIAMQMEGVAVPRPMTHDLMKSVLERVGVEFQKVLIHELRESTYYAQIFLRSNGGEMQIDSRPSDAIALAVRFEKPIFVIKDLFEQPAAMRLEAKATQTLTRSGITVQPLSEELADHFELPVGRGVIVSAVSADAGGELEPGDVILEVDGRPVRGLGEFEEIMASLSSTADLSVQRAGREIHVAFEIDGR